MKTMMYYLSMVFMLWIPNVIGTSSLEVEENKVSVKVEQEFELSSSSGCFIPEPITCLPYFNEWMYYEDLCLSGEPNPNPFCPNPCHMADYYRQAFFSCEIQ
jgi:hypothetical protein